MEETAEASADTPMTGRLACLTGDTRNRADGNDEEAFVCSHGYRSSNGDPCTGSSVSEWSNGARELRVTSANAFFETSYR